MPSNTPNIGAPLWDSAQASPWLPHNQALRILDAFATRSIIETRADLAPPVSCADGARFLVGTPASGLWAGRDGQLAIAVGVNAANGWYFALVADKGSELYVRDENALIRHNGAAWLVATSVNRFEDLLDVSLTGLADGDIFVWDASNGVLFPIDPANLAIGKPTESLIIAASDESTALAAGTAKVTFRMPYAFTLTALPRASLAVAQASGNIFTVDIKKSAASILDTKLTIDNTQRTSVTAGTPAHLSSGSLADDEEVTIDISQIGNGSAKGLKVVLIGHRT